MKKSNDIIYNEDYLVLVPTISKDLYESFSYTFNNTLLINNDMDDVEFYTEFINKNNFKEIVFVDYQVEYEQILNNLLSKHKVKFIFTKTLGSLSNELYYSFYINIIRLIDEGVIDKLAVIDDNLYETLKNSNYDVCKVLLDIPVNNNTQDKHNNIGLLNDPNNNYHSFYNELSAIKKLNMKANIARTSKEVKEFTNLFSIDYDHVTKKDVYTSSLVNLCINFSELSIIEFLKSMDNGIPCILGNTNFLTGLLKEYLVVKSDDNTNEIANKIETAIAHKEEILKEYKIFRENYSKECQRVNKNFIKLSTKKVEKEYEKLLSIVVPVYNVEKFLANTLESILSAVNRINEEQVEILIINDGSKDGSEKIIKKYEKEHSNLIRYIKQENHGLGNVRNVALKEVKGKYIASIDSDDTINIGFFEEAYKYLKKDIDIVLYDWKSIPEEGQAFETSAIEWSLNNRSKYEGILFSTIMPSTCNKIIKKSLYDELGLKYIEDRYEDLSINPLILLEAKTIKYINKPYYEYYLRSGSIMRSAQGYSMIDVIHSLNKRFDDNKNICKVDLEEMKYYTFSWRIEEYIMNQLYTIDRKELKKYINYIYEKDYEIINNIFNSSFYNHMLEKVKADTREYIIKRNKAFEDKKIEEFIIKSEKEGTIKKITPYIVYYGEKD